MADETPAEREDRLQRAEDRLQKQHARLMEQPPTGGTGGGGAGGIGQFISEHRWGVAIGVIATVVVGYVVYQASQANTTSNNTASGSANNQGDLATAGYQTAGVAYGLDQITQQLNNIQGQLNNPNLSNSSNTPTPVATMAAQIRNQFSNPETDQYDLQNTTGVLIYGSGPGGGAPAGFSNQNSIGTLGYGSTINIIPTPVEGGNNFGISGSTVPGGTTPGVASVNPGVNGIPAQQAGQPVTAGSDIWYQIATPAGQPTGEYISAYDLRNIVPQGLQGTNQQSNPSVGTGTA